MVFPAKCEMKSQNSDRRRFNVKDAMLLVAASSPGLVLLRLADDLKLFATNPHIAWGI